MTQITSKNGKLYVETPYDKYFAQQMRQLGGSWDKPNWVLADSKLAMVERIVFETFGHIEDSSKSVTVEFKPSDIRVIGEFKAAEHFAGSFRPLNGAEIVDMGADKKDMVMSVKMPESYYNDLPEHERELLTVKADDRKENLEARKAALLAELAEIEKELQAL